MTKAISIVVVLLMTMAAFASQPAWADEGRFLIIEDFEAYAEGTRPPYFQLIEEGSGAQKQSVTGDQHFRGTKSFRLQGTIGLYGSVKVDITNPKAENYTFTQNSEGYDNVNIALGFSMRGSIEYYGCVLFSETGNIIFDYGEDQSILMPYEAYRWYDIGLLLNRTTKEIGAFVDGSLMTTAHLNVDYDGLDCIRMSSGESGVAGYIDDLGLYAYASSSTVTDGGASFPFIIVPIVTAAIGVPTLLLAMHLKSTAGMPRRALKIEEIMKAIGLGAPLLSFGLITTLNNRAFGEEFRILMVTAGISLLVITVIIVVYVLSKWKLEVGT
jgi:hypothetical protein